MADDLEAAPPADDRGALLEFQLLSAANYIDTLGGVSKKYRAALGEK